MSDFANVLLRRLRYFLTPQLDIYKHLAPRLYDADVLEIGFGTGLGVLQYISSANHVDAIDSDADAVAFALEMFPIHNLRWLHRSALERHDRQYDAIIAIETLEHIADWQLAVVQMGRALRPNGSVYLSRPNANANLRKNDLHAEEWTAAQFTENMRRFFRSVTLRDYSLKHTLSADTTATPLIAVCKDFHIQTEVVDRTLWQLI